MGSTQRPTISAGNGIPRSNVPLDRPEDQPKSDALRNSLKDQANTIGARYEAKPEMEFEEQQIKDSIKEQASSMGAKFNDRSEGVMEGAKHKMVQAKQKTEEVLHNAKEWVKEKTGMGKNHPEAGY